MKALERLGTRIFLVSRVTDPTTPLMDTWMVTGLAGKRNGPSSCMALRGNGAMMVGKQEE